MNYVTRDDILDLHAYIISRYGGLMGVKSQDRLLAAVNAPQQRMFDAELYPDLPAKAAILVYMIAKNRPFLAGNEGTALIVLLRFLELNDAAIRDEIGNDELFRVIRSINNSDIDRQGLEEWLRDVLRLARSHS